MNRFRSAAVATALLTAAVFPAVSASPASANAATENGASVAAPPATANLKPVKCVSSNRTVKLTATASKKIKGRTYGVVATRGLTLCTTKKNVTKVYSTSLTLKPINGLVKVTVTAGPTKQVVSKGVTTLTTPLTARAKFIFWSYKVTGTLRTIVGIYGQVISQVINVQRV